MPTDTTAMPTNTPTNPPAVCPFCESLLRLSAEYHCETKAWLWRGREIRFDQSLRCKDRQIAALTAKLAAFEALYKAASNHIGKDLHNQERYWDHKYYAFIDAFKDLTAILGEGKV